MIEKTIIFTQKEIDSIDGQTRFIELCKLQFRNDTPITKGAFLCLQSILNRIETSRQSFLLLLSKNHVPESYVIAGSMMEMMSIFDLIESEKDINKQYELSQKYMTECSLSEMTTMLELDLVHKDKNEQIYNAYMEHIEQLKQCGHLLLKSNKIKEYNLECIEYLIEHKHSNYDKRKFLNTNYLKSSPTNIVRNLINRIKNIYKSQADIAKLCLTKFYAEYNKAKHGNVYIWHAEIAKDGILEMSYGNMAKDLIVPTYLMLFHFHEKYSNIKLEINELN